MKILLIGSHGYIGTRLYKEISSDFYVDTLDTLWFGKHYDSGKHLYYDYKMLHKDTLSHYDVVILLAGHSSVKMCENNMRGAFYNNVVNFLNLIEKMDRKTKFIYASSSSIYSGAESKEVAEDYRGYRPNNYYDLTKSEIDNYASLVPGLHYYGLRFGTVNGTSLSLRNDIMINAMTSSAKLKGIIQVNNPEINRPILGIGDLCAAVKAIILDGSEEKSGVYNLASLNASVGDIALKVGEILGAPIATMTSNSQVYNFSMSTEKFQKAFNFTFKESVTSIVEGLSNNWNLIKASDRNLPFSYEYENRIY